MVKVKATREAPGDEPVHPSNAKAFVALIEAYKKQNPAKYALKEAELQKKLAKFKD